MRAISLVAFLEVKAAVFRAPRLLGGYAPAREAGGAAAACRGRADADGMALTVWRWWAGWGAPGGVGIRDVPLDTVVMARVSYAVA